MSLFTRTTSWKGVTALLSLPVFFLLVSLGLPDDDEKFKIGHELPLADRAMPGVDGEMHTLNELKKDNGLVVIFSCNTCPFVVGNETFEGWERQYNALHKLATEKGVALVLVNSNEGKREGDDSMDQMGHHAIDAGYTMPYLLDEQSELANAMEAKTTPHVFVFDRSMRLIYKGSIDNSWDSKRTDDVHYLNEVLDHLGGGPKIREHSTSPRGCSIKRVNS